jgi:iron complex transport system substrate-binding protein
VLGCPNFEEHPHSRVRHRAASDIAALKKVPTFDKLGAVAEIRAVYTDGTLAGAIYFISPLSLPYVLERLVPQLEAAVAGEAPQRVLESSR